MAYTELSCNLNAYSDLDLLIDDDTAERNFLSTIKNGAVPVRSYALHSKKAAQVKTLEVRAADAACSFRYTTLCYGAGKRYLRRRDADFGVFVVGRLDRIERFLH